MAKTYNGKVPTVAKAAPPPNTSSQVLEFLQRSPGTVFSPKEIAEALDLVPGRVSAALQYLSRQHPELVKSGRGAWTWQVVSETPSVQTPGPLDLLAPVARALGGADVKQSGLPNTMPALFEPVTTHRSGAVVLRDANGDLWLAQPIHIDVWPVLGALGFPEPPDEAKGGKSN